jgi:hypothetical protein
MQAINDNFQELNNNNISIEHVSYHLPASSFFINQRFNMFNHRQIEFYTLASH